MTGEVPDRERTRVTALRIAVVAIVVVCLALVSKPWDEEVSTSVAPNTHSKRKPGGKKEQKPPPMKSRTGYVDENGKWVRCVNGKELLAWPKDKRLSSPKHVQRGYSGHCGNDPKLIVIPYGDPR